MLNSLTAQRCTRLRTVPWIQACTVTTIRIRVSVRVITALYSQDALMSSRWWQWAVVAPPVHWRPSRSKESRPSSESSPHTSHQTNSKRQRWCTSRSHPLWVISWWIHQQHHRQQMGQQKWINRGKARCSYSLLVEWVMPLQYWVNLRRTRNNRSWLPPPNYLRSTSKRHHWFSQIIIKIAGRTLHHTIIMQEPQGNLVEL